MTIGQKVKKYREALGISQTELAQRTQTSQPYISMLEKDIFTPSAQVVVALAVKLGVSTDELLLNERRVG